LVAFRKNNLVGPFLKWVGGKRQLLPEIVRLLPEKVEAYQYIEPFIGGGAVFLHLQPENAIINDSNTELINVYNVVKNDVDALINELKKHKNEADYFYSIRNLDRTSDFTTLPATFRASRFIYLNKTCFNGLYRVNNAGEFNAPFGRYTNPNIINENLLRAVSSFLNNKNIKIKNLDYAKLLNRCSRNSFVYLDPPYHPISDSANFTGYVQGGWNMYDQIELKKVCDALNAKGVPFMQSNSSANFIKDLYKEYNITIVKAKRAINSNGSNRGEIDEVIIRNYE
jgi:DNA adenine methylase